MTTVFNIYFPDEIDEAKTIRDVVEFIMDMVLMEDEDEEEWVGVKYEISDGDHIDIDI